jgi:hypothetical protein
VMCLMATSVPILKFANPRGTLMRTSQSKYTSG